MGERNRQIEEIQGLIESNRVPAVDRRVRKKVVPVDSIEVEGLRNRLEMGARTVIGNYEQEVESLRPVALDKVSGVIKPWFGQLVEAGLLEQLGQFREGNTSELNDPIEYFRPKQLYQEIDEQERPFLLHTTRILSRKFDGRTRYSKGVERRIDPEESLLDELEKFTKERWTAKIYLPIAGAKYLGFGGLEVFNWPADDLRQSWKFYRGMYGGWRRVDEPTDERRERRQFDLGQGEIVLPDVNPTVLIQFADQIESGRVWERMKEVLKEKSSK